MHVLSFPQQPVTAFFSVPVFYTGLTFLNTQPLDSIHTITDGAAHRVLDAASLPPGAIPPIADLDLAQVNKMLFSQEDSDSAFEERFSPRDPLVHCCH